MEKGHQVRVRMGKKYWGLVREEKYAKGAGQNLTDMWWRCFSRGFALHSGERTSVMIDIEKYQMSLSLLQDFLVRFLSTFRHTL